MSNRVTSLLRVLCRTNFRRTFALAPFRNDPESPPETTSERAYVLPWHLASAVCLERYPLVAPPMDKALKDFRDLCFQKEMEKSLLSDFEVKQISEKKREDRAAKRKEKAAKDKDEEIEAKTEIVITAKEFLEASDAELRLFTRAPLITEADNANDMKSLQRQLTKKLVLLVEQENLDKIRWQFPQAMREPSENMRQTAERALKDFLNVTDSYSFFGNAPIAFYKKAYPPKMAERLHIAGVKIFFFKAFLSSDFLRIRQESKDVTDYMWLTHEELFDKVSLNYRRAVSRFLFE